MSFSGWVLGTCVFIFVILVVLGIGWWIRNNSDSKPAPPNKYNAPQVWGPKIPSDNHLKNTCQLYQFPGGTVEGMIVPGNPTFNAKVLDSLQGTGTYPACLDPDQTIAIQVQHTCYAPVGVVDGAITRCNLISGGYTGVSGTEVFYSSNTSPVNTCFTVSPCAGELSVVSLAYESPAQSLIYCAAVLNNSPVEQTIEMYLCDPTSDEQLFRITRINPFQNPASLKPGHGQQGLFAQVLHRETGLCLVPGTSPDTTIYSPVYFEGCGSGNPQFVNGKALTVGECVGGPFPGYVWFMLPSVSYCSDTGTTGCTAGNTFATPPQMIYIGDLNFENIPLGTGYAGLTGTSAIVQWFLDNDAEAAYFGALDPNNGGNRRAIVQTPIGTDVTQCIQRPFTAQYLTIPQYNTAIAEAVCLANGTLGTIYCTNL